MAHECSGSTLTSFPSVNALVSPFIYPFPHSNLMLPQVKSRLDDSRAWLPTATVPNSILPPRCPCDV